MSKALILTGTNMQPCKEHLDKAITLLRSKGLNITSVSSVYKSPAWGYESKNEFLNQILIIETRISPFQLMKILLETENEMGRKRTETERYQDRTIDLDILLFDKEVIISDELTVPHPRMELRRFALLPAAEVAGNWVHPVFRKTIAELLENCGDQAEVTRI